MYAAEDVRQKNWTRIGVPRAGLVKFTLLWLFIYSSKSCQNK